jgi:SnoaL-like domain
MTRHHLQHGCRNSRTRKRFKPLLSNFVIDVKGDTATAWSRWAFVVPVEKGAVISQAGRYDDTLMRENGR